MQSLGSDNIRALQRTVTMYRRMGDRQGAKGNTHEAIQAYRTALELISELLDGLDRDLSVALTARTIVQADEADEIADLYGVRGGLQRRCGHLKEANQSYASGARIERDFDLTSTYNRTNDIRVSLLAGTSTLELAHGLLRNLEGELTERLTTDERASDDAWLWADLGDIRLLLGDATGAASAYSRFVSKSRSESPLTALSLIQEISTALSQRGDSQSVQLQENVSAIASILSPDLQP